MVLYHIVNLLSVNINMTSPPLPRPSMITDSLCITYTGLGFVFECM